MEKYKYLFKNIGLLTFSNFSVKLLTFFMVPLYTNVLSTEEYGLYDLCNATISILIPILTFNILEAVLRYSMDKEYDRSAIFTIGIANVLFGALGIICFLIINHFFKIIKTIDEYAIYFFLMFIAQSLAGVINSFARGADKILDLSIGSIISAVVTILTNIIFLLVIRIGLPGYFLSSILGYFAQIIYISFKLKAGSYLKFNRNLRSVEKNMHKYSIPMIANSIGWWINSVSDRYVIVYFCGISSNGIYAIASKIPAILNILQTVFNQAWALSSVKDFDPEDKSGFFSTMYNSYNGLMIICCSFLITFDRLIAHFLYSKQFFQAWRYVPFLLIAIVFGAASGYLGGIFSAVKDSKMYAKSTVFGSVVNIVLNIVLVPEIGVIGAAASTAISYWSVYMIRLKQIKKYIDLKIYLKRDYISYLILIIQTFLLLIYQFDNIYFYLCQLLFTIINICLYIKEAKVVLRKLFKR